MINLFRKNSMGIGTWRCWTNRVSAGHGQIFVAHSVVEGGSEVMHVSDVVTNMSGRTIEQQMDLELRSRASRQLDKGYKPTRDEALLGSTNQMGLRNPMLAQKIADVKLGQSHFLNAFVQRKYNGHRCMITKQNGDLLAYTRKGKPVLTIPHILTEVDRWIQDGDTLDGELYIHGRPLQSISSLIKAEQPDSRRLNFLWYDMMLPKPYVERYKLMKDLSANIQNPQVELATTWRARNMHDVYMLFDKHRAEGYEGSMLRLSLRGYEDAKRSDQLIKIKARDDCEVTVIGCRPSSQGWAILRVKTDWGVEFDISAPGSVPEKTEVLQNFDKYDGRRLTIEYAELTSEKVPFHAVAMQWKEDL